MKSSSTRLFAIFALVLTLAIPAIAANVASSYTSTVFTVTPITAASYTPVVTSLARTVNAVSVYNTGSTSVILATGASGSEVAQLKLSPMTAGVAPVVIPWSANQGQRISIKASTGTISTGDLILNFFYN